MNFAVEGLVETPTTWTWDEIHALPPSTYEGDIHCVTTWSKLGMTWNGVSVDTLPALAAPLPSATHVLATSHTGYTTNLPLADVTGAKVLVAWEAELRHARNTGSDVVRLVVSVRSPHDLSYADELPGPEATIVSTRDAPTGWPRLVGRLTVDDLTAALPP